MDSHNALFPREDFAYPDVFEHNTVLLLMPINHQAVCALLFQLHIEPPTHKSGFSCVWCWITPHSHVRKREKEQKKDTASFTSRFYTF